MSNEITLKFKCTIKELCKLLEKKQFKIIDRYILNDTYFIPEKLELKKINYREILSTAIILRDITELMTNKRILKLTFKKKEIDKKGNILKQSKIDCEITDLKNGKSFIESIGYKEIMNIREKDVVYERDGLQIAIKDIKNGDSLIEVEIIPDDIRFNTIEKVKQRIKELKIPIYTNDYFIKKAEIELSKVL